MTSLPTIPWLWNETTRQKLAHDDVEERMSKSQEPVSSSREEIQRKLGQSERSTNHGAGSERDVESDAKGAYAKSQADRTSDGVASADPRVLSGKNDGDATFPVKLDRKPSK